jgi:hypothetical protein
MDVIYVDFDGVAHPSAVWYEPATKQVRLKAAGHELFESLPVLEAALLPYPNLKIILSSSWVQTFGFEQAQAFLPKTLQLRVIGATYDPQAPNAWRFSRLRRYDAIALDVQRRKPTRWLAIDDDALGWPKSELDALVLIPSDLGLACPDAQARLHAGLATRFG